MTTIQSEKIKRYISDFFYISVLLNFSLLLKNLGLKSIFFMIVFVIANYTRKKRFYLIIAAMSFFVDSIYNSRICMHLLIGSIILYYFSDRNYQKYQVNFKNMYVYFSIFILLFTAFSFILNYGNSNTIYLIKNAILSILSFPFVCYTIYKLNIIKK